MGTLLAETHGSWDNMGCLSFKSNCSYFSFHQNYRPKLENFVFYASTSYCSPWKQTPAHNLARGKINLKLDRAWSICVRSWGVGIRWSLGASSILSLPYSCQPIPHRSSLGRLTGLYSNTSEKREASPLWYLLKYKKVFARGFVPILPQFCAARLTSWPSSIYPSLDRVILYTCKARRNLFNSSSQRHEVKINQDANRTRNRNCLSILTFGPFTSPDNALTWHG